MGQPGRCFELALLDQGNHVEIKDLHCRCCLNTPGSWLQPHQHDQYSGNSIRTHRLLHEEESQTGSHLDKQHKPSLFLVPRYVDSTTAVSCNRLMLSQKMQSVGFLPERKHSNTFDGPVTGELFVSCAICYGSNVQERLLDLAKNRTAQILDFTMLLVQVLFAHGRHDHLSLRPFRAKWSTVLTRPVCTSCDGLSRTCTQ